MLTTPRHPGREHFQILAERMIRDHQTAIIDMCHTTSDAEKWHRAQQAARLASVIARHLASGLERDVLF